MRSIIYLFILASSMNIFSQGLSEEVVTRLVKEDIREGNGRMLGVTYVDSLDFISCDDKNCLFHYSYQTTGCYWENCYDLTCTGELAFDLIQLQTEPQNQECIDN